MKRDSHPIFGPCHELEAFDPTNDEHLKQIVPAEMVEPLMGILSTLANIRRVRASFGKECLNVKVAIEGLEKDAEEIERACKTLWREC